MICPAIKNNIFQNKINVTCQKFVIIEKKEGSVFLMLK